MGAYPADEEAALEEGHATLLDIDSTRVAAVGGFGFVVRG